MGLRRSRRKRFGWRRRHRGSVRGRGCHRRRRRDRGCYGLRWGGCWSLGERSRRGGGIGWCGGRRNRDDLQCVDIGAVGQAVWRREPNVPIRSRWGTRVDIDLDARLQGRRPVQTRFGDELVIPGAWPAEDRVRSRAGRVSANLHHNRVEVDPRPKGRIHDIALVVDKVVTRLSVDRAAAQRN